MSDDLEGGLHQLRRGLERANSVFDQLDASIIEAMQGLHKVTLAKGSLDARMAAMEETIKDLQRLIMEQGAELRALRERLNGGPR
jgi:chromosome segregation ATPase